MFAKLFTLTLLVVCARAQYCEKCNAEYQACAASCYAKSGYKPACVGFTLAGNRPPQEDSFELFPSECAAECYFESFGSLRRYSAFEVEYLQKNPAKCEQEWKTYIAATYTFEASLNQYKPYIKPPVAWVKAEIAANSSDYQEELAQLQSGQVDASLGKCFVCDKSLATTTPADGPSPAKVPKPAPAPKESPSPDLAPIGLAPIIAPKPPPRPSVIISALPTITPVTAPVTVPALPTPTPAPAPVPTRLGLAPLQVKPINARVPAPAPAPSLSEERQRLIWIALGIALAYWFW